MDVLHDPIEAGVPIVGLEPSCISVFRDELIQLFPRDHTARSLAQQVFSLGEFLEQPRPRRLQPPRWTARHSSTATVIIIRSSA